MHRLTVALLMAVGLVAGVRLLSLKAALGSSCVSAASPVYGWTQECGLCGSTCPTSYSSASAPVLHDPFAVDTDYWWEDEPFHSSDALTN